MIEIRPIEKEDLTFLAKTETALFSDPWKEKALQEHFLSPFAKGYLCLLDRNPAGYLLGTSICKEGEILRIGVPKPYRRKGIGKRLVSFFLEVMKKEEAERIFLEVRESNFAAISLYEKTGFLLTGRRLRYYTDPVENALLYQITL